MNRNNRMSSAFVGALVLTAGMAFGQAATETKSAKPADEKPVLKGPEVKDNSLPGTRGQFAPGNNARGKDALAMRGPNPRLFRQAVMSLKNEQTPEDLRLTPTQEQALNLITDDTRRTAEEYRGKHMDEVRELMKDLSPQDRQKAEMLLRMAGGRPGPGGPEARQQGGPRRGEGFRPEGPNGRPQGGPKEGPDGEMMPPPLKDGPAAKGEAKPDADAKPLTEEEKQEKEAKAERAKARLKEIMESAPKPQDAESRVYAVLTDGQKALVEKRMTEMQAQQQKQAAERRGGKGEAGQRAGRGQRGQAGEDRPQLTEEQKAQREAKRAEMREKLKNMSPEERKAFLDDMRAKRQARQDKNKPGESKPAPGTDSINPPAP